jgi:hypothetical protein
MGIRAFITRHPVVQGILLHWTSPIGRLVGSHLASGEARAQDGGSGMSATGGCTMTEQPSFRDAYQRWWCIARDAADEILRSPDDAEDVAQRVLVKAWTSGTLAGGEHAESYFRVAARRGRGTSSAIGSVGATENRRGHARSGGSWRSRHAMSGG